MKRLLYFGADIYISPILLFPKNKGICIYRFRRC